MTTTFTAAASATTTSVYSGSTPDYTDPSATDISANLNYQWQVDTVGLGNFTDLVDGGIYSGVTTNTLTLTAATAAEDGNIYRIIITHDDLVCYSEARASLIVKGCNNGAAGPSLIAN